MDREQALQLVRERVKNENLVNHMLATEAIMGALARRLGGDPCLAPSEHGAAFLLRLPTTPSQQESAPC